MVPIITSAMLDDGSTGPSNVPPSRVRNTTTERDTRHMSHTIISRTPRPRRHVELIAAIAHAEDIDHVNTLVNEAGFETYEEFWAACEAEFAAR
jgi:hypothetical protein